MPIMILKLQGDNAWPELQEKDKDGKLIHLANDGPPIQVAVFDKGMSSGLPSVAVRMDLPDGQTVLFETSARLFCSAGKAIMAKYPHLFD